MKRGLQKFLCVSLPKVLGGAGTVAVNLLLMRHLGAQELGLFSVCLATVLLIDAIAGAALDMSTVKLGSKSRGISDGLSHEIQKHAIYLKLIIIGTSIVLARLGAPLLRAERNYWDGSSGLVLASCLALTGMLLFRSSQVNMQLEERFLLYGMLDLLHLLLRFGGVAICIALGCAQPWRILLCYALAPLAVTLFWAVKWGHGIFSDLTLRWSKIALLWRDLKWFLVTFSLSALISRMDLILLSWWSNLDETGIFAGAQAFATIPQMLGFYLSVIFQPNIMPHLREGIFFDYFRSIQKWILLGGLACLASFLLGWRPVSGFLLPSKYYRSSSVIEALMPGALAGLITFPLTLGFIMFVRPRFLLLMDCLTFPVLLLFYFFAIHRFGAIGAAWTTTSAAVIRAFVAQLRAWRWAREAGRAGMVPPPVEFAKV